jgi:hypothetical protein
MSINKTLKNLIFSDKMNSRNMILSGALVALVMLVTTNVFFTSSALAVGVNTGITPNSGVSIYTVKKAALICDQGASAPANQMPPELGGCIDIIAQDSSLLGTGPVTDARFNEYLFSGEQLAELVVARDINGGTFLPSTANLAVGSSSVVTCTAFSDADAASMKAGALHWYGHDVGALLNILPPQQGTSDPPGYQSATDKIYNCLFTVTGQSGSQSVTAQIAIGLETYSTVPQQWYFNPAITVNVGLSSGTAISFPPAQAGQTVYSTNTLMISNNATGGVDLAVYLVGADLTDSTGVGLCPTSNVLNVSNMAYRCKVGTYMSEVYTPISHLKEANLCHDLIARKCLVQDFWTPYNDLLPDASSAFTSLLYNGHTAECWFQLKVPVPCMGTFSAAKAVDVLVRAI